MVLFQARSRYLFAVVTLITLGVVLGAALASAGPASAAAIAAWEHQQWNSAAPPDRPAYPSRTVWRSRHLCELSNLANVLVDRTRSRIGVAVVDLIEGEIWIGGDREPFTLHSVVKVPIAWLTLTTAERRGEPLPDELAEELRQMIAWSDNEAVTTLLNYLGGLTALRAYYYALGLEAMAANIDHYRWGYGAGRAADVAETFAVLTTAESISPGVRADAFTLLKGVVPEQRWGASTTPNGLPGWEALVKTGQFAEPGEGIRVNSAAVWLDRWQHPRYAVAIMIAEQAEWGAAFDRQNEIGAAIADALMSRERRVPNPPTVCHPLSAALLAP